MSAWIVMLLVGLGISGACASEMIFPRASNLGAILFAVFAVMLFLSLVRALFRRES